MSPSSRHELSGNADESLHFKVSLNEEVEYYLWAIYLQVGTGSANLYIRQTYEPSTTQSDCNPQKSAEGFLICNVHAAFLRYILAYEATFIVGQEVRFGYWFTE